MLYPPRYRRSRPCVVVLHCDDSRMRITDTMEILIRSLTQIAYNLLNLIHGSHEILVARNPFRC